MTDKKQVEAWLQNGTINQDQATKMLSDSEVTKSEESSNKFITIISSIGAVLFGIGAILFVALNWDGIPDFLKIILLLGLTFGSYFIGYILTYKNKNYPRVGAALTFLGALLFGASVFLIAQIYNLNSSPESTYSLLFLWLLGVVPVVYFYLSKPIASLVSLLFIIFITLFVGTEIGKSSNGFSFFSSYERFFFDMLIIVIIAGIILFAIGGFHYYSEKLKPIARVYRLFGLRVSLLVTFVLSMNFVYSLFSFTRYAYDTSAVIALPANPTSTLWVTILGIIALIFSVINIFFNFVHTKIFIAENAINIGLLVLSFFAYFFIGPVSGQAFHIIFNIVFIGILLVMLYIGYQNRDMTVVNQALGYFSVFIVVKYFEWFWGEFNPYMFFMVGGLILILGGVALERKRRQIRIKFKTANASLEYAK